MDTLIIITIIFLALLFTAWLMTQLTVIKAIDDDCTDCCDVFDDDNPDQAVHRESAGNWCKCGCDC